MDFFKIYFVLYLSAPGSNTDKGGPTEEEDIYPGWREVESSAGGRRPGSLDQKLEEKDRRMEERKTKVLNILSKLQDATPRQPKSNKGHSNFEDCEFIIILLFYAFKQNWPLSNQTLFFCYFPFYTFTNLIDCLIVEL